MTGMWLLMGLLLLAYMGSFLVGGRTIRGLGLPSGAEYIVLGFVVGPHMLGLVGRGLVASFSPIAEVTLGWLGLVAGVSYGFSGERRTRASKLLAGELLALASSAIIAAPAYLFFRRALQLQPRDALAASAAIGLACGETTRHVVRWVALRYDAQGGLVDLLTELTDGEGGVPFLATAFALALLPQAAAHAHLLPPLGWAALALALGATLGVAAAVLLGREFRLDESWGVLLGATVLTVGLASRLALSPLAATFALGATLALVAKQRTEVVAMAVPTERPFLMPALVLAGARINLEAVPRVGILVALVLAGRVVSKLLTGSLLRATATRANSAGPTLGLGLLSSGPGCIVIGYLFALRSPGVAGDAVLVATAAVTVFGEFVGPYALRAALRAAGEISATSIRTPLPISFPPKSSNREGSP